MRAGSTVGAFFDVDGTLCRSDIFRDLVAFRRQARRDPLFLASVPFRGLALLVLDQFSRVAVNHLTYSWYAGFSSAEFATWAASFQEREGRRRLLARPVELLAQHARQGHRIVLLTGAVDLLIRPLPDLLARATGVDACRDARVEAVGLMEKAGRFTGKLTAPALAQQEKARRARAIAQAEGLDLSASFAYGDSIADLPLLAAVGRPAAIRPDARLRAVARRRGWPVVEARDFLKERS